MTATPPPDPASPELRRLLDDAEADLRRREADDVRHAIVQRTARRARRSTIIIGVLMAAYCAIRGFAYLPAQRPGKLPYALDLATGSSAAALTVWAAVWFAAGALCVVAIFRDAVRWTTGAALMAGGWGLFYLIAWIHDVAVDVPTRDYLNASSYLVPCLLLVVLIYLLPGRGTQDATDETT